MTDPTPQQILDLELPDNDAGAETVRDYLTALLRGLWIEEQGFSGKRPFGNSGWQYDLYAPMAGKGWIGGTLDEDGYAEDVDTAAGERLVLAAIAALGNGSDR